MRTSSCISRFSVGPIFVLLVAAIASGSFSWDAKRHGRVDNDYWGEAVARSRRRAAMLDATGGGKCVMFGGSTVRTSYLPSVLADEFGIPFVNMGVHAGLGADVLAETAFSAVSPGDTVVVAVEPELLSGAGPAPVPSSGVDFYLHEHGLSFRHRRFFTLSPLAFPGCLRNNSLYNAKWILKRLLGKKPYRYTAAENLHEDGWMEVSERRLVPYNATPRPAPPLRLGPAGRDFLLRVRRECETLGCRAVYHLPPRLEGNPNGPAACAAFLLDVLPIMPVVRDPLLGCNPNPNEFADMIRHPTAVGALRATRSFGAAFAAGRFWDLPSLKNQGNMPKETPPPARPWAAFPSASPKSRDSIALTFQLW